MAFFPRTTVYSNDQGFAPLFRLLDDFENFGRQSQHTHRHHVPSFQPRFDVRETEDAYELHGELAGMKKEDVHIEFADPQTLTVRGKVVRSYTAGTPPAGLLESDKAVPAIEESEEQESAKVASHKATVEDDFEEVSNSSVAATPTTEKAVVVDSPAKETKAAKKPTDKYWVTERSIGQFARNFNFPTRIEAEEVSASLKDGILNITVPKAKKHEARRIQIA